MFNHTFSQLCIPSFGVNSDDEAVAMVAEAVSWKVEEEEKEILREQLAAKVLVEEAVRRGSGDNLSAAVVFF
jgi:hypothetical protein